MRTDTGQTIRLQDYAPAAYRAPETTLMVVLHPERTVVRATTVFEPVTGGPLQLAGDGLILIDAKLDGRDIAAPELTADGDTLVLKEPPRKRFELTLTTVTAPDENTELMGLYRSNGVYCTQCEAEGFRRITYAYDRPDVLTKYDVWIQGPDGSTPVILSNGNRVESGVVHGKPYARWRDPFPKPTYLFAMVAGDLGVVKDTFRTRSGRRVELAIYVEHGKEPRAAYAMDALKRSMRWDEERWGREYDLDVFNIVAVSDFNMGAMENKGLNVFNDRYVLADPETATDADYAGIETVIAHEYFHNWTGNRVTCRDWFQLSLKEGLTVFRDQEFTSDVRSRGVKRVEDVRRLRLSQFPEDAGPLRHPVRPREYNEISNLYTATVYEKGAEVIRVLQTLVGPAAFDAGIARYFQRFDGTAATVEDFLSCFDGVDREAFLTWYEEAGTPTLEVAETFADGRYTLTLIQRPFDYASLKPMPVRVALFGPGGKLPFTAQGAETRGDVVVLTDEAHITLTGLDEAPVASVLRGFSAPVTLERTPDVDRDLTLLTRDDDPFVLWDTSQRLTLDALTARYRGTPSDEAHLAEALQAVAANEVLEPAFRAMVLSLPTRKALVQALGSDVDAARVVAVHRDFAAALGRAMGATLSRLRARPAPAADDVSAEAAGRRALRNAALALQVAAGETGAALDAADARNMTDRLAALNALVAAEVADLDAVLSAFMDVHLDEPLVLDKAFSLQAMRTDGDPVARTQALMEHEKFSLKNPNRLRSVVGVFAQNLAGFHRPDGAGYRLVADVVRTLDGSNPQVAARLATAFNDIKWLDAPRREAATAALDAIRPDVRSSDVADILRRLG